MSNDQQDCKAGTVPVQLSVPTTGTLRMPTRCVWNRPVFESSATYKEETVLPWGFTWSFHYIPTLLASMSSMHLFPHPFHRCSLSMETSWCIYLDLGFPPLAFLEGSLRASLHPSGYSHPWGTYLLVINPFQEHRVHLKPCTWMRAFREHISEPTRVLKLSNAYINDD